MSAEPAAMTPGKWSRVSDLRLCLGLQPISNSWTGTCCHCDHDGSSQAPYLPTELMNLQAVQMLKRLLNSKWLPVGMNHWAGTNFPWFQNAGRISMQPSKLLTWMPKFASLTNLTHSVIHFTTQTQHGTLCPCEKTGARGKGGACDAWTEQVREPHLNNTHTHTLKTLTHFHPLYVHGASSSGFSRY